MDSLIRIFLFSLLLFASSHAQPPCEVPDNCGYLPSTYSNLSLIEEPFLCFANCTLEGGFDLCKVCGSPDPTPITRVLLEPFDYIPGTRMGGSVANWNGTVAISQYLRTGEVELYIPTVEATVITWNLNHTTNLYSEFEIPSSTDGGYTGELPMATGYGLCMSEHYLLIGSYDTTIRLAQLWVKSTSPPWFWKWTATEICMGNRYGYAVGIDERIPKLNSQGGYSAIIVGDPGARFTGRVYVYYSTTNGLADEIYFGFGNETIEDVWCFGEAVSADTGILAVGAPSYPSGLQTGSGLVVIYTWDPSLPPGGKYVELLTIEPPVPTFDGGFGISVSVYLDLVMIGDNMGNVYMYGISGFSAIPLPLAQPDDLNPSTSLGQSVSLWSEMAAAGDGYFDASPAASGKAFVWTPDFYDWSIYLTRWSFTDDLDTSMDTHFARAVDVRGGCYLAAGVINEAPYGGVYMINLCDGPCYGCDGTLNSCNVSDYCGVCNGDNSTCTDCLDEIGGPADIDACGVCQGTNNTCILPTALSFIALCNTTSGPFNLTYAWQSHFGMATWIVALAPEKGNVTISIVAGKVYLRYFAYPYESGLDYFILNVTQTSIIGVVEQLTVYVELAECLDCEGVVNGTSLPDLCGVCEGNNTDCAGCDDVPWSGLEDDYCGECGGTNLTCLDIIVPEDLDLDCISTTLFTLTYEPSGIAARWKIVTQAQNGMVVINAVTGVVSYHNNAISGIDWFIVNITSVAHPLVYDIANITLEVLECVDCNGDQLGTQINDACGVCGGNSGSCADCLGIPNGTTPIDVCGVCEGDGTICLDCNGVPNGTSVEDLCGVCDGLNECTGIMTAWGPEIICLLVFGFLVIIGLLMYCAHFTYTRWDVLTAIPPTPPPPAYPKVPQSVSKPFKYEVLHSLQNSDSTEKNASIADRALLSGRDTTNYIRNLLSTSGKRD